jgi:arsenate reductase (glutaredoxin)
MSGWTIFHNPRCSTSRQVLAALRQAGIEPAVVEYLKTPPDRATLLRLAGDIGQGVRGLVRAKEALYTELGLDGASDDALLDAMQAHPVLINRPIVVSPRGTRMCRPSATVQQML